ncbi:hypothetical protein [Pedobacter sp. Leaf132]|uniref:hypothetical protein n=1 Tax=Pedobacter sp. Leaf132 TaxID=2876557 RepID=UPI001E4A75CF|nr:hypothetical protein [Pedobacter sp. Leaf132]
MKINKQKPNVRTQKKRLKTRLPISNLENFSSEDQTKKTGKIVPTKPKDFISKECSKYTLHEREYLKKTDNNIDKIYESREEKLLNLIVKIIVKSTLKELYGKEGN